MASSSFMARIFNYRSVQRREAPFVMSKIRDFRHVSNQRFSSKMISALMKTNDFSLAENNDKYVFRHFSNASIGNMI